MKRFLTLVAIVVCAFCEAAPLKVVVIGGGPTGLGAAIEARIAGADVIVVEKRHQYTRENTLFLTSGTLALLDKWCVEVPEMQRLIYLEERRGVVLIKYLEEALVKRAHELDITILRGEFKDFANGLRAALIDCAGKKEVLRYDVLVGADGAYSRVREKLGIATFQYGQGICSAAIVPAVNEENRIGLVTYGHEDLLIKKITIPSASLVFMQNRPSKNIASIGPNDLIGYSHEVGMHEEAELIEAGQAWILDSVPVYLTQAETFSNPQRSVILLGESAGCTSYYRGNGTNYSYKTIPFAGDLFRTFPENGAFDSFEYAMRLEIGVFLHESLALFSAGSN